MRTEFFAVLSTATLVAIATVVTHDKWPQRSRHAVVVARVEKPHLLRAIRNSNAPLEDAVRRARIFERSIAMRVSDQAGRYEAMVATGLPGRSSKNVHALLDGTRDDQQCSA
jgi:hypothetical protein